jgi:hypothetical protein
MLEAIDHPELPRYVRKHGKDDQDIPQTDENAEVLKVAEKFASFVS